MNPNIIVIDDFYDDPWEIYQQAVSTEYNQLNDDPLYPGRNSICDFSNDELYSKLNQILNAKVIPCNNTGNGHFRYALEGDKGDLSVHCDMNEGFSGVIYLTLPTNCHNRSGTNFYIHKQTGLDMFPNDGQVLSYGYSKSEELYQGFVSNDSNDESVWEKYCTVKMKYNRLVLFNSRLWHSPDKSFGNKIENSRLVQLIFSRHDTKQ